MVVLGPAFPMQSAQAEESELDITLASVIPNSRGLTLMGTVYNSSASQLYQTQVVLWRDNEPITTTSQLAIRLKQTPDTESGVLFKKAAASQLLTNKGKSFGSGQTIDFAVYATWDDLGIGPNDVYLVGVRGLGSLESKQSPAVLGQAYTLVTRARPASATLVMLNSAPSLIHDDVFQDDHLQIELQGRLAALLNLARLPGVSWAIDPGLFNEILVMSSTPGDGQDVATKWLEDFKELDQANGYRLPWMNPDLALGLATSDIDMIGMIQATAAANLRFDDLPLLVRAGNGMADQQFIDYVSELQPQVILAQVGSHALLGDITVINTAIEPFPNGPTPDQANTFLQRVQRCLADNALSPEPVVRVIEAVPTTEDVILAEQLVTEGVAVIPLRTITPAASTTALSGKPAAGPLTESVLASYLSAVDSISAYTSLIADPSTDHPQVTDLATLHLLTAILSASWPSDFEAIKYADAVTSWIKSSLSQVVLTATSDVALPTRIATFPVTITNDLEVPVFIRVSATKMSSVDKSAGRIDIPTTQVVAVEPGSKLTLPVSTRVVREGDVDATLRLTTANGIAIGSSAVVRVSARASAWMGWAVVASAFVLFGVGTFLRVRSARKKAKS